MGNHNTNEEVTQKIHNISGNEAMISTPSLLRKGWGLPIHDHATLPGPASAPYSNQYEALKQDQNKLVLPELKTDAGL